MPTPPLSPELTSRVLTFLGVDSAPPTLALLDALVAAYVRCVPWESAFRIAKRARTAQTSECPRWPQEFWRDAFTLGGGGTCFESNYAFFSLLRTLDYEGYLTINNMGTTTGCHTAAIIELDKGRWLVDVGLPLYAPLPLDTTAITWRSTPFFLYTVRPQGNARYQIERSPHPRPYCYTLLDTLVVDATYRAATTMDYGPGGNFLDRVIVTKVIDDQIWRINCGEQPLHIEAFQNGGRTDYPLTGRVATAIAERFALDVETVRAALEATGVIKRRA